METLHKGKTRTLNSDLEKLYPASAASPEAAKWRAFLKNHTIEFLGGGNSKNFKVTDILGSNIQVLKIDNRLDMPRHIEQHLRERLGDVFAPIHADRQVRGRDPRGEIVSRTLLVTDLCTGGSLKEHSQGVIQKKSETDLYINASDLMGQMAQVLMDIQKADCCFPDAKLTNWLVDEHGKIKLADTKSFVRTEQGLYNDGIPDNEGTEEGLITTHGFRPREIGSRPFNAEKLHANILGRNIYAYLTGENPGVDFRPIRDKEYDDKSVFKSPLGQEYKQLIQNLVQDSPDDRMNLQDVQVKLMELGIKAEHEPVFKQANKLGISSRVITNLIQSEIKTGVSDKAAIVAKIKTSLNDVQLISDNCNKFISNVNNETIKSNIKTQMRQLISQELPIGELKVRLKNFESNLEIEEKYDDLKVQLNALKIGQNDTEMVNYLETCDYNMEKISSNIKDDTRKNAQVSQLLDKMNKVLTGLKSSENNEIKTIINQFDERSRWYTVGMRKKARGIEDAMAKVPIEERARLLSSTHSTASDVLKALASHRISWVNPLDKKGDIIEEKAANAFKLFKARFKEQIVAKDASSKDAPKEDEQQKNKATQAPKVR